MAQKPPEKVRFQFVKQEDYQMVKVSGVYGGVPPRGGDLICHCFYEYLDLPVEERLPIKEGRPMSGQVERLERVERDPTEVVYRRDLKVGLVIPLHQAESFANWILDNVKKAKEQAKEVAKTKKLGEEISYTV